MCQFKKWITDKLGYEPRQIDLANELGETRGELVRKWFKGVAYPDAKNCVRIAKLLDISEKEVQKAVLRARVDDIES